VPTRTAEQRRQAERAAYDAYLSACPTRKLLDEIAGKWVSLVLVALGDGPRRYSDLSRRIAGVSQKMLTQTLRVLERDGLVRREVTPAVPRPRRLFPYAAWRKPPRADGRLQGLGRGQLRRRGRREDRLRRAHAGPHDRAGRRGL